MSLDQAAWIVSLIGLAMVVGGLYASWNAWYAFVSRRWPSVPGWLHFAGIYGAEGVPRAFGVTVRYEYNVDGVVYQSTRLRFGAVNPFSYLMAASELAAITRTPDKVLIYYDARNPKRACLITGPNEWTLIVPIVLLVIGIPMLWLSVWSLGS